MSAEKLSISLDVELAVAVRKSAAEQGVSVSQWLAEAAESRVRQRLLREGLDALAEESGALSDQEIEELSAKAREQSMVFFRGRQIA